MRGTLREVRAQHKNSALTLLAAQYEFDEVCSWAGVSWRVLRRWAEDSDLPLPSPTLNELEARLPTVNSNTASEERSVEWIDFEDDFELDDE